MLRLVLTLAAVAGVVTPRAWADPAAAPPQSPASADVRAAVRRSLPYLEAGGTAWMRERKCNSCHTVTFMVWSHRAAAERGLPVDLAKLAEWEKWSLDNALADNHWFKLRPRSMDALKAAGLPADALAKLNPLAGKVFLTRKEFLDAAEKALGPEGLAAHRDAIMAQATLPNDGGGADTLSQLLLARPRLSPPPTPDAYAPIRALLLEWQEPDGSWAAAGQLPALKWADTNEMNQATTMWALLATADANAGAADHQDIERSRRRALDHLKSAAPGITLQSLALHLMVAHRFAQPDRAESLRNELLARQNADGGWSWLKENPASDAFATGQALYALAAVGRRVDTDPAVARAAAFLLHTQAADGGWPVPQAAVNTRPRKLNVYPYWGTAWAVIGLLESLPPSPPATGAE